jgi:hypothetical protein
VSNYWQPPEGRQGRYERAAQRRERRQDRYRQEHPPQRPRHFPHNPYQPRLVPQPTQDRAQASKLFSWMSDGIKAAVGMYEDRPDKFRLYSIGHNTEGYRRLERSRCRSEKAELLIRIVCLMLTAAQCSKGANYSKYEVGSWRGGNLWRWTLEAICEKLGVGDERPSIDQVGDALNCLAAMGWSFRHQPGGQGPANWKITRTLLEALRVSKRFHASEGTDPDLEYYLRQVHGENRELHRTAEGRHEALKEASRRVRESRGRPPPKA